MRRMRTKLFLGFLCMAVVTIAVLWLIQAGIMKDNYLKERVSAVDEAIVAASVQASTDYAALEERLNVRLLLLDGRDEVRYISPGMPMKGMVLRLCQSGDAPQPNGEPQLLDNRMAGGVQYALLGRPLPGGGALYAVFSLSDVQEASRILLRQLWVVTAALLAASVLLALVLSRLFTRPLHQITGAARALAAGRLGANVEVRSRDEIGQLALALNELSAQLSKTEALRRELIANVSHELRSPLAVIQGYAETVRDVTWPHPEKRQEQLSIVASEAARLSRIVEDILDYSRLQAGVDTFSPEDLDLRPMLERMARKMEIQAADRNLSIRVDCLERRVRFDSGKLERVMDNLLGNAINHGTSGTEIVISAAEQGASVRIAVANSGDTIEPEELPHIWDRFYRAQRVSQGRRLGTGLGLAIVKSILEQHGSAYGVASREGRTTFWFDAPIAGGTDIPRNAQ